MRIMNVRQPKDENRVGLHDWTPGFDPGREVSNPQKLYGRNSILNSLKAALRAGVHTQVVAERKFGKSSLMRCLQEVFREEEAFCVVYVPVNYLKLGEAKEFYAWVSAYVASRLSTRNSDLSMNATEKLCALHPEIPFKKASVSDILASIWKIGEGKIFTLFESLFMVLVESGICTILLLDEISDAAKHFEGERGAFAPLRQAAMSDLGDKLKALTVCISDRAEWQDMAIKDESSPALNFISNHIRLAGIPEDDARLLIRRHADYMDEQTAAKILDIAWTYPFYLKVAGEKAYLQLVQTGKVDSELLLKETYDAVRGHLRGNIRISDKRERDALVRIVTSPVPIKDKDIGVIRLFGRGLLRVHDGFFCHSISSSG